MIVTGFDGYDETFLLTPAITTSSCKTTELSDAAIEAADVVIMDDDPLGVIKAIKIGKKCMRIAYENIYFAIGIKVIVLILSAFGLTNMWLAVFADVGVMILAVLNAIRTLHVPDVEKM